jgi:hypothetical protein
MSGEPTFEPEPMREFFDSDEAHLAAWLAWADGTPGGWRARWAERTRGSARGRRIRVENGGDRGAVAVPVGASRCCRTPVIVDPLVADERRGLCSSCRSVVDRTASGWHPAG